MDSSQPHTMPWTQDWLDKNPGRVHDYHLATMVDPIEAGNVHEIYSGFEEP